MLVPSVLQIAFESRTSGGLLLFDSVIYPKYVLSVSLICALCGSTTHPSSLRSATLPNLGGLEHFDLYGFRQFRWHSSARIFDIPGRTLRFPCSTRTAGNARARPGGGARSRKAGNTISSRICRATAWVEPRRAHLRAIGPYNIWPLQIIDAATFPFPLPLSPLFSSRKK